MECIRTILIKGYPREIQLSKARRAKYFKPTDKLPGKYLGREIDRDYLHEYKDRHIATDKKGIYHLLGDAFIWKKIGKESRLHSIRTLEDVIKNPKAIGTPRKYTINGQSLYNGKAHQQTVSKVIAELKAFWIKEINKIYTSAEYNIGVEKITTYPVFIHYHFECNMDERADVDNYSDFYRKSLQDSLVKCGLLIDDKRKYVAGFKITSEPIKEDTSVFEQQVDKLTVKIYANSLQEAAV